MAGNALVIPGADQVPQREPGLAQRRQPGPARPGEVLRRRGVVRRGGAARRRDPGLDRAQRAGQVEVGAVAGRRSRRPSAPAATPGSPRRRRWPRLAVQVAHGLQRGRAGQHPLRLGVHLLRAARGTAASPRRTRPPGPGRRRSSAGRRAGSAPRRRRPGCPRPAPGTRRPASAAAPSSAAMAAAAARSSSARSGAGTSASRANSANQPRPASLAEPLLAAGRRRCATWRGAASSPRLAPSASEAWIPASAAGTSRHPPGDHRPVVRGGRGHGQEQPSGPSARGPKMFDSERSVLARRAARQAGLQPLAQQPGAAPLVVVRSGHRAGR